MDSSLWFNTINFGWSIVYLGVSHFNFSKNIIAFLSEDLFTLTNSIDPGEMPHNAAFHLGLHYLLKYPFRCFQYTKGS